MNTELPENITSAEKQPSESDTAACSIPYHTLALESDEKILVKTTTKKFPDGRKISVGVQESGESGIFVKIYKPLDGGKESLLSFRISEEAGAVLCYMLYDVLIERPSSPATSEDVTNGDLILSELMVERDELRAERDELRAEVVRITQMNEDAVYLLNKARKALR